MNDVSLLAVLVQGRDFPNLLSAFRNRLVQRLWRIGLSQEMISVEQGAMGIVQIQPSNNRSVLGSMNDFVYHLRSKVGDHFSFAEANALEDMLSEIPMGALNYHYPVEVAAAVFSLNRGKLSGNAS